VKWVSKGTKFIPDFIKISHSFKKIIWTTFCFNVSFFFSSLVGRKVDKEMLLV